MFQRPCPPQPITPTVIFSLAPSTRFANGPADNARLVPTAVIVLSLTKSLRVMLMVFSGRGILSGTQMKIYQNHCAGVDRNFMAERVGFEPTVGFPLHSLSRRALSTAQTPLRDGCFNHCNRAFVVDGSAGGACGQAEACRRTPALP